MKVKIKFKIDFAAPFRWIWRKIILLIAFSRSAIRETIFFWREDAWSAVDTEENDRIIWIGTIQKGKSRPTKTYYGTLDNTDAFK